MRIRHKVPKEASKSEMNEKVIRDAFSNYDDKQSFNLVIY